MNRIFNNPFKFITLNTLIFICFEFLFTTFLTNQLSLPVERKSIILSALTAALIAGLYSPRKIIFLWVSVKFSSVIHLTVDDYYLRGFGFISISV